MFFRPFPGFLFEIPAKMSEVKDLLSLVDTRLLECLNQDDSHTIQHCIGQVRETAAQIGVTWPSSGALHGNKRGGQVEGEWASTIMCSAETNPLLMHNRGLGKMIRCSLRAIAMSSSS